MEDSDSNAILFCPFQRVSPQWLRADPSVFVLIKGNYRTTFRIQESVPFSDGLAEPEPTSRLHQQSFVNWMTWLEEQRDGGDVETECSHWVTQGVLNGDGIICHWKNSSESHCWMRKGRFFFSAIATSKTVFLQPNKCVDSICNISKIIGF